MAGSNTTYKVDIQYDLKGNAARGLAGLKQQAQQTTSSMGGLRQTLALVGGGALFAGGYKALIGFNNEIGRMKIGLSTVIATQFHKPFATAQVASEKLFQNFQKMAIESPATTKDFVEMSNMIAGGVLQAGMGLKELESITKGAVIASAALGARPDMLALDVQQMLAGRVEIRDRYAQQLLAGVGETDFRAFNQKSAGERAGIVQKAFNTEALQSAAKAYADSFEGVTSTLKDNIQLALGTVGLPLFKAITEEVKGWNKWIADNPGKIADMASRLGNGLKSAFSIVKDIATAIFPILQSTMSVVGDVLSFAANHKDTLVKLVEGLLVYKGVSMGVGLAKGGAGMIGGLFGQLKDGFGKMAAGLSGSGGLITSIASVSSGFLGMLGPIAAVGGALYGLFSFLTSETEDQKREKARLKAERELASNTQTALQKEQAMRERLSNIGIKDINDPALLKQYPGAQSLKTELEGYTQARKEMENKSIQEAIAQGMVKEELGPGGRRLFLSNMGAGGVGTAELMKTVQDIFKRRFNEEFDRWEQQGGIYGITPLNASKGRGSMMYGANFWEDMLGPTPAEDLYKTGAAAKPPEVNVTINKIEVYSDDPDRFVHQAVNSFEEIVRNPTAARGIMRGAF